MRLHCRMLSGGMASAERRGANKTHNKNEYLKEERKKENQREGGRKDRQ